MGLIYFSPQEKSSDPELPISDVDGNPRVVNELIDIGAFENQTIVGIKQQLNISNIAFYPNPADDFIIIKNSELFESKIEIHDLSGKIVLSRFINANETEKRIKRLGERSQEISGIVNLINSIAERTHILALNASMHAASAGEAGRGFAVVADEVQRLAENAREATSEISTVVNNIRVETSDTVTTMNTVISQVAEGTRLAELAGLSMKENQQATNKLVDSVQQIANSSVAQADVSKQLLERAKQIQESNEQTGRELYEQTKNTDTLVQYSHNLVSTVGVFTLPDSGEEKTVKRIEDDTFEDTKEIRAAG